MDEQYFETIYKKYFHSLCLFALRIVHNSETAKDMVQDVFTSCWMKRDSLDCSFSLKPYLYKLTYNRCIDFLKLCRNKNVFFVGDFSMLEYVVNCCQTSNIDDDFYKKEIESEIKICLYCFPENYRKVFQLKRYTHLKNAEIAKKLNLSTKTIEKYISKVTHKIHIYLLQQGYMV
ncbi:MAG: RNA polymerase sigma-70 factor [Paludibacteraceae bacterium]|nr:RNA polymerase sigma-70 factor [Paludibacteraceae bacterium]MBP8945606.1 RNA polymerase sigma-70 factor [Paludibacteraceae bacterium]